MLSFPLSDAQFVQAATRLRADGIELSGPTGTIAKDGITASYTHANGTLSVKVVNKPMFIPESLVEARLTEYFHSVLKSLA